MIINYQIHFKAAWPSGKARDCKSFIPGSNPGAALRLDWGCGGMVDTTDLKSVDYFGREGSSPSTPIDYFVTVLKNSVLILDSLTKEIFPVRAISVMPNGVKICSIAIIFPGSPVTSRIRKFSARSTTLALKI